MSPVPPLVQRVASARGPVPKFSMEAWEAAWTALEDGPKPRPFVVKAMMGFSGLSHRSSVELLRRAVDEGYLVIKDRDEKLRPILARAEG